MQQFVAARWIDIEAREGKREKRDVMGHMKVAYLIRGINQSSTRRMIGRICVARSAVQLVALSTRSSCPAHVKISVGCTIPVMGFAICKSIFMTCAR